MARDPSSEPPEFLTVPELAALLRIKERKVYDLAASGAVPCSKITGKILFPDREVRAWIASGRTDTQTSAAPRPETFLGSHDPLLDWALRQSQSGLATYFDGSSDGLTRYLAGEGVATGMHIRDTESGDWNIPAVAQSATGQDAVLVAWATRARGLVLRAENTDRIGSLRDLRGARFAARQAGSGAQVMFNDMITEAGLSLNDLTLSEPAPTETDAVLAVVQGEADAALGLEAIARPYGLAFLPLVSERFDILIDRKSWFDQPLQRLWAFAKSPAFAQHAETLAGYDMRDLGTVRWNG